MKAFLMHKTRDLDLEEHVPANERELTQDLELNALFEAMALGDKVVFEVAKHTLLTGLTDRAEILYRQTVLRDCLNNSAAVRELYDIAAQAIEDERKHYWGFGSKYPSSILRRAVDLLEMFMASLKRLRNVAEQHTGAFASDGFATLFTMLRRELSDEYFAVVQSHLNRLAFRDGVLASATLGTGNKGTGYVLRKPLERKQSWAERMFAGKPPAFTFYLHPRDEGGARALSEMRDRGINLVADALAQSTDHILNFFSMLRTELAFYIGCVNLHERLAKKGEPICFPVPLEHIDRRHSFRALYDICLSLSMEQRVVGNDLTADNKDLVMITGANRGGKSTFLRSIGLSQLMMQSGMFVPAESFCANICDGVFTHYKREEDAAMESGKLDEELGRMSGIIDNMTANPMLLFNESFAATNEREGSEIARQIVCALLERRVKIFFVTHLYELAHGFFDRNLENAMFLRAERQADRKRTFKLIEGEPLQTSYGEDLYARIFGADASGAPCSPPA